jgi:hypothetical protein
LTPFCLAFASESASCSVSESCSIDCSPPLPPWKAFCSVSASLLASDSAELRRSWSWHSPQNQRPGPCWSPDRPTETRRLPARRSGRYRHSCWRPSPHGCAVSASQSCRRRARPRHRCSPTRSRSRRSDPRSPPSQRPVRCRSPAPPTERHRRTDWRSAQSRHSCSRMTMRSCSDSVSLSCRRRKRCSRRRSLEHWRLPRSGWRSHRNQRSAQCRSSVRLPAAQPPTVIVRRSGRWYCHWRPGSCPHCLPTGQRTARTQALPKRRSAIRR